MHCHTMVYVRIILTTTTTITCLLGDSFVEVTQHPLLRAVADNGTHALIGAFTGIAFVVQFQEKVSNIFGWLLIFTCFAASSLIDLDHFIEARSFSLEDATSLIRRPFLHCSSIVVVIMIFYITTACLNYFRTSLMLAVLLCAFLTHHTRDAVRRGYWFCPLGHTKSIPQWSYIVLTILTPYIVCCIYDISRSVAVQRFLGQYIKLSDNGYYRNAGSSSHAGYRYLEV